MCLYVPTSLSMCIYLTVEKTHVYLLSVCLSPPCLPVKINNQTRVVGEASVSYSVARLGPIPPPPPDRVGNLGGTRVMFCFGGKCARQEGNTGH